VHTQVFGTHVIDFTGNGAMKKHIFEGATDALRQLYQGFRFDDIFRFPPPTNPMNIADYMLCHSSYKKWTNHWFEIARQEGPCQAGNIEMAAYSPLSSTGAREAHEIHS